MTSREANIGRRVEGVVQQPDRQLANLQAEKGTKSRGMHSELMDTLIVYRWPDHIFPSFQVDPATVQRGTQP